MQTVKTEFAKRVREIDVFFRLLRHASELDTRLSVATTLRRRRNQKFGDEVVKVLKANTFLLLYNLMESTLTLALESVYDEIARSGLTYGDAVKEIRKLWIQTKYRNFRDSSEDVIYAAMETILHDQISMEFKPDKRISGNVNQVVISGYAKKLGFSDKSHPRSDNGNVLDIVKKRRNDLAHGSVSFSECGRDYTFRELSNIRDKTVIYLRSMIRNVEAYLRRAQYRS